jgi:hypothetical protein
MRFVYAGREFPQAEKPTFGEIAHLEKLTGQALDEWTSTTRTLTTLYLSARREGLRSGGEFLTWAQMQDLSPQDFDAIDDEDEPAAGDADPPGMTGEPSPSDAPPGTDEADGSSPTE